MVNFYLRLTGEEGEPVPQYVRDVEIRGALFPSPGPEYRAIFSGAGITTYEGILPSGTAPGLGRIDATTQLSLTGHSLGGHLASAFALLLPSVTEQTATFNSAGFIGLFGEGFSSFASLMQRSILELPLNTSTHASVPVMDFASPQDPVSRIPGTSHLGDGLTSFSIEGSMAYLDSQPLYNHTIDPLVDALAVGSLLDSLAIGKLPGEPRAEFSLQAINDIIDLISMDSTKALERVVAEVQTLLLLPPITVADTDHDSIYQAIPLALDAAPMAPLSIESVDHRNIDAVLEGAMADDSDTSTALRYALANLLPMAFTSFVSTSAADDEAYDRENMSDQYLSDRAFMLSTMTRAAAESARSGTLSQFIKFTDLEKGISFDGDANGYGSNWVPGQPDPALNFNPYRERIVFGSNAADVSTLGAIEASANDDHLYGLGGDDVLHGLAGNDHIEGGSGNDELHGGEGTDYLYGDAGNDHLYGGEGTDYLIGGAGADTYYWNAGEGDAFIGGYDDAGDRIVINGVDTSLVAFMRVSAGSAYFRSDDLPGITLHADAGSLTFTQTGAGSPETLQVLEYDEVTANFGIELHDHEEEPLATSVTVTELGYDENQVIPSAFDRSRLQPDIWPLPLAFNADLVSNYSGGELFGLFSGTFYGGPEDDHLVGDAGENALLGLSGDDLITGGGAWDYLAGGAGSDIIHGGAGVDAIFGSERASQVERIPDPSSPVEVFYQQYYADRPGDVNILDGGADRDFLGGGQQRDEIAGGTGNDYALGGAGNDLISGGSGVDFLFGDSALNFRPFVNQDGRIDVQFESAFAAGGDLASHADEIHGGAGDDVLWGELGDDILHGDAGDDILGGDRDSLAGSSDFGLLASGDSSPILSELYHGNDQLFGGEGNDTLMGHSGHDLLSGGSGTDRLLGGWGNDIYLLRPGDGVDQIEDTVGIHTLVFQGIDPNALQIVFQDSEVRVGQGDDWLAIAISEWGRTDIAVGSADNPVEPTTLETLHLDSVGNVLLRVPGLRGLSETERNSIFSVAHGSGTPRVLAGPEAVSVSTAVADPVAGGARVTLTSATGVGINLVMPTRTVDEAAQVLNLSAAPGAAVSLLGLSGVYSGSEANDSLGGDASHNQFFGGGGDDHLRGFAGNDILDGGSGNDRLEGGDGNDSLSGSFGEDILIGGRGDDDIAGGHGDIYRFASGDGLDIVHVDNSGGAVDMGTIVFGPDIDINALTFDFESQNTSIGYGAGNAISLEMSTVLWQLDNGLSRFRLVSEADPTALPLITRGDATNTLYGSFGADHIIGDSQSVVIIPGYGDDIIETSVHGSSVIMNQRYMAIADKGIGNKQIHLRGDHDTIRAPVHQGLTFHYLSRQNQATIHYDWSYPEVNPYAIARDSAAGTINYLPRGEDTVVFGDGLTLEDLDFSRIGSTLSIGIDGEPGMLVVDGFFTSFDAAVPGAPPEPELLTQEGHIPDLLTNPHVLATMPASPIARLHFDDGSIFDLESVLVERLEVLDLLPGSTVAGTFGSDYLNGSTDSDDVIQGFGGNDEIVDHGGTNFIDAGSGNDNISVSGNNTIFAGDGHDHISSLGGGAVVNGGEGNDFISIESGFARVHAGGDSGVDTLEVIVGATYTALDIPAPYSVHEVFLTYFDIGPDSYLDVSFTGSDSRTMVYARDNAGDAVPGRTLNAIIFADGTVLSEDDILARANFQFGTFFGTASADLLTGTAGDDFFFGDAGDDTLHGGSGHDAFMVSGVTHGYDRITGGEGYDIIAGMDGNDLIGLTQLTPADSIERIDGRGGVFNVVGGSAANNILDFSATEMLHIIAIVGGGGNDTIIGSNGNDYISGDTGNDSITGGGGNDTLFGRAGNDVFVATGNASGYDTINGGAGFDILLGGEGNDLLGLRGFSSASSVERIDGGAGVFNVLGGNAEDNVLDFSSTELLNILAILGDAGDDTITGSTAGEFIRGDAGDDIISGGGGADVLVGGAGNDTYLFAAGDGQATLRNGDASDSTDTLQVTDSAYDELWFSRDGNHLTLDIVGSNDSILLENWYADSAAQLDIFTASERTLQRNQVDQLVSAMASFDIPEGIDAFIPADTRLQLEPTLASVWQAA